jgi:hypothetical protein
MEREALLRSLEYTTLSAIFEKVVVRAQSQKKPETRVSHILESPSLEVVQSPVLQTGQSQQGHPPVAHAGCGFK